MAELLTPLDIVNQSFRKGLRGYDSGEVDDFLDQVAESLQSHIQKAKDMERSVEQVGEQLKEYREFKDSIQEALLLAQRTSEERVRSAQAQADAIIAEAQAKAERMLKEADDSVTTAKREISRLQQTRDLYIAEFKGMLAKFGSLISGNTEQVSPAISHISHVPEVMPEESE